MTTRLTIFGGTDWTDGEVLYAADQNDTLKALDGALGDLKSVNISIAGAETIANQRIRGWAIQDGTTPASQGITDPDITTTDDMRDKFLRMSDDNTSGTTGGNLTHNHRWYDRQGSTGEAITGTNGGTGEEANSYNSAGNALDISTSGVGDLDIDYYTDKINNEPPYFEVVIFGKVKI